MHHPHATRETSPESRESTRLGLGDLLNEVKHAVGVAPLVVVPRDELDEVVVERDAGLGVEDGRVRVGDEVGRDDVLVRVREDALHRAVGGLLDLRADVGVRGALLHRDRQVHDRDVGGRHAEGHAGQHAVEARQHLADGLGSASARGDDVEAGAAATPPVLGRGAVDHLLRRRHGVHRRHQALGDRVVVVDDLGERREAVGRARGVRHDRLACILTLVDAHDEHRRVARRRRDDDLLGAALLVKRGLLERGEDARRLDDEIGARRAPRDGRGILLVRELDLVAVNGQVAAVGGLDHAREAAVGRIVLHHILHVLAFNEWVIDGHDLHIGIALGSACDKAANAASTVDTDAENHGGEEIDEPN